MVYRREHSSQLGCSKERLDEGRMVWSEPRYAIALLDSEGPKGIGEASHPAGQFAVAEAHVTEDQRRSVGTNAGATLDPRSDPAIRHVFAQRCPSGSRRRTKNPACSLLGLHLLVMIPSRIHPRITPGV
jgi:hypothetical protein